MEASALPASVGLARARLGLGAPLLRLRSDEQLVSLFRAGNEDAFRVIHDRYRSRMLAYTRQMLAATPGDAEDAVQEIFVRAYAGLRTSGRDLALRAWLYRIAHNRCVDELRRPRPIVVEEIEGLAQASGVDPHDRAEEREALARLIADVRRLPEQQRSALLMRELGGMPYADVSGALGVTVPAVKSLLVRARVGLAQASEARDTTCAVIREGLIVSHDRGVRSSGLARRHMRDCPECRRFRSEVRGVSHRLSLLVPALGPVAVIAKVFGFGGSGAAAGSTASAAAGTGAVVGGTGAVVGGTGAVVGGTAAVGTTTGVIAGGSVATVGAAATGVTHVVTIIAATVVAAGGAIGIQHAVSTPAHHARHHHAPVRVAAAVVHPAAAAAATPSSSAPSGASAASSPASPSLSLSPSSTTAASAPTTAKGAASGNTPHLSATTEQLRRAVAAVHTVSIAHVGRADPSETGLPLSGSAGGVTDTTPTTTDPTSTVPTTTDPTSTVPTTTDPTSTVPTTTDPTSTVPVTGTPTTPVATVPVTAPVTTTPGATTPPAPTTTAPTSTSPTFTEPVTTPAPTSTTGATTTPVKLTPASGSGGAAVRGKARVIAKHAGTSASWTATGH